MAVFGFDEGSGNQTWDSRNGIAGDIQNGSWTRTHRSNGIGFNGTDTYITTNSNSKIVLRDTFTIDIVFKCSDITERRFLFGMRQPQDVSAEITETGKFRVILHDGIESTHLISLDPVDDNSWHAVSIVHQMKLSSLYLDGVKQKDSVNANLAISNSTNLLIGHLNLAEFPGRFFYKGEIDLLRFSKVARSEVEFKQLSVLAKGK